MVSFVAVVAVVGVAHLLRSSRSSHSQIPARKEHLLAPDFTLPQLDGPPLRLSSYRGKVVLLDFWATWCDPCREEIPHFVDLQKKYSDRGFQIIGVSMDDGPEPVRVFHRQFPINYPLVMGNAKIGELYGGILGLPIAFLLDRDGRIYTRHVGATSVSVFDNEISELLKPNEHLAN